MAHLTHRFDEAVRYAHEVHGTQTKKGTSTPYLAHLIGVASIVLDDSGDEDEAIGALLHDAAEDHGGRQRVEDIRARFGDQVAKIVEDCTDSFATPPEPWAERKMKYAQHARLLPPPSLRVSVADKVHNTYSILRDLRTIGEQVWERYEASPDDVLAYLPDLGTRVSRSWRRSTRGRARAHRAWDRAGDGLLTLLPPTGQMLEHSLPVVNFPRVRGAAGWPGRARVVDGRTAEGRVFQNAFESESP